MEGLGVATRAASSASMEAICARIGARAGEPGRARARLAAGSRRVRSSSPALRPPDPSRPRGERVSAVWIAADPSAKNNQGADRNGPRSTWLFAAER